MGVIKKLVFSFMFLFLVGSVYATEIQKNPVTDTVVAEYFNQPAVYSLTVNDITANYYQIYTLTDVSLSPRGYFYLSPGSSFNVNVYPTSNLKDRGYYAFTYYLQRQDGEKYEDKITVKIVNLTDILQIRSDYIDPNNDKATFYISNNANINLQNIKVRFTSPVFDTTQLINLTGMRETEVDIDVDKEKMKTINAGSYVVNSDFYTDEGVKTIQGTILLTEKQSVTTQETSSGSLIRTYSVKKTNTGNVPVLTEVTIKKDIISRLFTSFSIEPSIVERKGFYVTYTWNKKLQQTESFTVETSTNYLLPFLTIILAGIVIFGFRKFSRAKIEVKKSVSYVKAKGGEFGLKVSISVKARKPLQNVSLIDKVPQIVKVHNQMWSVKPTKIDAINRRVTWDIGNMNQGEERQFSYIVYSRIGVVGKFALPESLVVFEKDGVMHEVESNQVFFLADQITKDE